jgi:hypothetical protein
MIEIVNIQLLLKTCATMFNVNYGKEVVLKTDLKSMSPIDLDIFKNLIPLNYLDEFVATKRPLLTPLLLNTFEAPKQFA